MNESFAPASKKGGRSRGSIIQRDRNGRFANSPRMGATYYWIRSVKPHDDGLIPTGKNEHFENAFPKCVAKREISVRIGGKPIFY